MKTIKNNTAFALTGILLVMFAAPAMAEKTGKRKSLDTDEDGFVSQAEWDAVEHRGKSTFADLDLDGDGRISEDELKTRKRKEGRGRVRDRSN